MWAAVATNGGLGTRSPRSGFAIEKVILREGKKAMNGVKTKALAGAVVLGMVAVPAAPSWASQRGAKSRDATSSYVPTVPIVAAQPAVQTLDPSD